MDLDLIYQLGCWDKVACCNFLL